MTGGAPHGGPAGAGQEFFASFDGTRLAFSREGGEEGGCAVVLHHGFASSAEVNWRRPGTIAALVAAGRRVIAFDARGHGASDHPHEPAAYRDDTLARDVVALADHLSLRRLDLVGYSMGAFVALAVAGGDERVRALFLGGIGVAQARTLDPAMREEIARALEVDDVSQVAGSPALAYRTFAAATRQDRLALAALQRGSAGFDPSSVSGVGVPALVVNGRRDTLAGDPCELAALMPAGECALVPGDHLSAVTTVEFRRLLVEWATRGHPGPEVPDPACAH